MKYLRVAALILLFFFSMLFFVQNHELLSTTVRLNLQLFSLEMQSREVPYYLIVLLAFAAGGFISLVYLLIDKIRLSSEVRKSRSRIKDLEEEVNSLRNMPLNDESYSIDSSENQESRS
jgi:lipopolysaccharide assembly protein A